MKPKTHRLFTFFGTLACIDFGLLLSSYYWQMPQVRFVTLFGMLILIFILMVLLLKPFHRNLIALLLAAIIIGTPHEAKPMPPKSALCEFTIAVLLLGTGGYFCYRLSQIKLPSIETPPVWGTNTTGVIYSNGVPVLTNIPPIRPPRRSAAYFDVHNGSRFEVPWNPYGFTGRVSFTLLSSSNLLNWDTNIVSVWYGGGPNRLTTITREKNVISSTYDVVPAVYLDFNANAGYISQP